MGGIEEIRLVPRHCEEDKRREEKAFFYTHFWVFGFRLNRSNGIEDHMWRYFRFVVDFGITELEEWAEFMVCIGSTL